MKTILSLLFFITLIYTSPIPAQEKENTSRNLISKLSWLSGCWIGEDGRSEELWSSPSGNNMIGSYRVNENGLLVFAEFSCIIEKDSSLVLRMKQFDGDFIGFEEKESYGEYYLTKIEKNSVFFDRLSYELLKDGRLKITISPDPAEPGDKEQVYFFKRKLNGID